MQEFIAVRSNEIAELCRQHHVRRLSIFGSAVRADFNPVSSDIDVRVEFAPEALDDYIHHIHALHDALAAMFGRKVDLLTAPVISNRFFRREVEETQVTLYAA